MRKKKTATAVACWRARTLALSIFALSCSSRSEPDAPAALDIEAFAPRFAEAYCAVARPCCDQVGAEPFERCESVTETQTFLKLYSRYVVLNPSAAEDCIALLAEVTGDCNPTQVVLDKYPLFERFRAA